MTTEQMDWLDDRAREAKGEALAEVERNGVEPLVANFDACECGDYRLSHEKGKGRCSQPKDLAHGFKECRKFRQLARATFIPEPWAKWLTPPEPRNPHMRAGTGEAQG